MLKLTVEEVALTPATVPLSKRIPVVKVEADDQIAALPAAPPESEAPPVIPKVEVATHWVLVPVVCRTIPKVPEALVESNKAPVKRILPEMDKVWVGVAVPIPTLPPINTAA